MILLNRTKLSIGGVDVYPDDREELRFWYIPGKVRLAEQNGKKKLSYVWYRDEQADKFGTGYLNFEVNTAVDDTVIGDIKHELARQLNTPSRLVNASDIRLSEVTYTGGKVNFSVLGPLVTNAPAEVRDASVIYRSKEQMVWQAGSSSLVGDNSAVCAVTFTKEGRLANAMKQAILKPDKANVIAAAYSLEYRALRPAVSFKVTGDFKQFIEDFRASVGMPIPLEGFVINLAFQTEFEVMLQKRGLKIELVNYTGDDKNQGLKWARKILMEKLLDDFFVVKLDPNKDEWTPLKDHPESRQAAGDAVNDDEEEDEEEDEDKEEEEEEEETTSTATSGAKPEGGTEKPETSTATSGTSPAKGSARKASPRAQQKAASSTSSKIPAIAIDIRIKNYTGFQQNVLDFEYSQMDAITMRANPNGLVLEGLDHPKVVDVYRDQDPTGLSYEIEVAGPKVEDFTHYGLRLVTLDAHYPAGNSPANRQPGKLTFRGKPAEEENRTLKFQYDQYGSTEVGYEATLTFDPSSDWVADATNYKVSGKTKAADPVDVMPGAHLDLKEICVKLDEDFSWSEVDQVVVTIASDVPDKSKRLEFTPDAAAPQYARFRFSKSRSGPRTFTSKIELFQNDQPVGEPRIAKLQAGDTTVKVRDTFASHTQVILVNALKDVERVYVEPSYDDEKNNVHWVPEEPIEFERNGQLKKWVGVVPTKTKITAAKLPLTIVVTPVGGTAFTTKGSGGVNQITGKPVS